MKKAIYLSLAILFLMACNRGPQRYTQNSPEIDTVKKHIANYNSKNYDTSVYADTSKTYFNTKKNPVSANDVMKYHKEMDVNYSSRGFLDKDQEYEMVLTDDGETWVNCWLDWKGTLAANNQEVEIPVHLTYQFIDGKIVREVGFWNPTEIVMALQAMEAKKETMEETAEQ
ncbi:nuclear transport factor 2 family protein [Maribacter sp. 2304DJ31-5]|uniref:nuclear transport factor 2 family protein n=1 Tax=Maribacter sp. 2304DJ31-5 TaxID=3386273 RepID=UPI0039BCBC9F